MYIFLALYKQTTTKSIEIKLEAMAVLNIRCLALASFLLVIGVLLMTSVKGSSSGGFCDQDLQGLINECTTYVAKLYPKITPSKACCDVVKKIDAACVCAHVTKEIESLISMAKAVDVAKYCGRPLPHGYKCGSYTVPIARRLKEIEG